MIIEIKNLPEGRNVKKINFDILFEDGDIVDVDKIITNNYENRNETILSEAPKEKPSRLVQNSVPGIQPIVDTSKTTPANIGPQITTENREVKEIPNEMLDQTF